MARPPVLLQLPASFYSDMAVEYQAKRDAICASLTRAGLPPSVPTGAYYVLAEAASIPGADSKARACKLLADTGIAAVSGAAFFATDAAGKNRGDHLLRFCFAKKDAELDRGVPPVGYVPAVRLRANSLQVQRCHLDRSRQSYRLRSGETLVFVCCCTKVCVATSNLL